MLIKFETKSSRVKCLAFHPKRRWLLVSLHNGIIQLWDYSEKTLIDVFDEHKGPVRGLDFHRHQPLFVSGADDAKIKVWNYKFRRCLFTLDAHEDYIRSTFFHQEHPWIVSASDDQSIRIWNWQSRSRIAVLTGHTHYIMCAQFHPANELILSASIDQTLRLWDISGLKMKNKSKSGANRDEIVTGFPEILSKTDYSVESKEAHNSEINWCAFHNDPSKQLCLSGGDDNYIKVWKIDNRNGLRELDTLRGHYNNVSCATFVTINGKDIIISVSEDRSIKIWDVDKRCCISTHRRETDRFWTCAAHPKENLFAAGHDTGVLMFKLEKERIVFSLHKDVCLYIKGRQIIRYNLKTKDKRAIQTLMPRPDMTHHYHRLHCHNYDDQQINNIVVSVRSNIIDKSVYELYQTKVGTKTNEPRRSPGLTAISIGPNRLAILDHSRQVIFRINNEERKAKITIKANEIFEAGPGRLLIKHQVDGSNAISLWDIEKGCALHTVKVEAKSVVMSEAKNYIACVGSHKITLCDGQLRILSTITDQRKIKSVIWEDSGVLVYSTPAQIKYVLTNGYTTTIVSVKKPVYLITIRDSKIYTLDRSGEVNTISVDTREFRFKQAVIKNDRPAIMTSIRSLGSLDRAEIAFLVQKGHPGLALRFVDDHHTRFPLALKAFDIDEALKSAQSLNQNIYWQQLADTAMQVGNVAAVEKAYKELKKPYKLAMLYLTCNQRDKLHEARAMARDIQDLSTEFIISLLLKDFVECVQIMRRRGYSALAYISALNHGLEDLASDIKSSGEIEEAIMRKLPMIGSVDSRLDLESRIPDIGNSPFDNWPLLNDETETFEEVLNVQPEETVEFEDGGDWEDDEFKSSSSKKDDEDLMDIEDDAEDGWKDDDEPLEDLLDDDDDDEIMPGLISNEPESIKFNTVQAGQSLAAKWIQTSDVALHHLLAGSYKSAIGLLQKQVGLAHTEPLADIIKDLMVQSKVACRVSALHPIIYIYPSSDQSYGDIHLPEGGYGLDDLSERLTDCYALFSLGKFNDATLKFRNLLLSTLFVQIQSTNNLTDTAAERETGVREIIANCKEYILALRVLIERKNIHHDNHKRSCELAAYLSKLNLPKHRSKVLEKAFEFFTKAPREYQKTQAARSIAQRLLDHIPSDDKKKEKLVLLANKVKQAFDIQIDQQVQLAFDPSNPYSLCAATLTPIYLGNQLVSCPLCGAKYKPEYAKSTCKVCLVAEVGKNCSGIRYVITNYDEQ